VGNHHTSPRKEYIMKNNTFIAELTTAQQNYILGCLKAYAIAEEVELNIEDIMNDRLWVVEDIIDMGILETL
jgi:hypothetical protein